MVLPIAMPETADAVWVFPSLITPLIPTLFSFFLILISWTSYHEALRSPQPRIPRKELNSPEKYNVPDVLRAVAFMLRSLMMLLGVCEVWALCVAAALRWNRIHGQGLGLGAVGAINGTVGQFDLHFADLTLEQLVLAREICPSGLLAAVTASSPQNAEMYARFYPHGWLPALAAVGLLIQASGACLRIWSQRTLGRFFTWELTILRGDAEEPIPASYSSAELKGSGPPGYQVFELPVSEHHHLHHPEPECLYAEEKRVRWLLGVATPADSESGTPSTSDDDPENSSSSLLPSSLSSEYQLQQLHRLTNAGVEHKLITSGPYAYVRHPGYSGAFLLGLGQLLFGLSSGTYLNECVRRSPILGGPWRILDGAWVVVYTLSIGLMISRTRKEDVMLRREFGREWDVWARETRWRLIPYVF